MESISLDVERWSREQFGSCQLGDRRRNERLVKFARQVAANPSASTPDQTRRWADCKAAYRLMDCSDIEFEAILAPHCQRTRAHSSKSGRALLIHDKTEVSFSTQREPIEGLGPTGNNWRQGFYLHTALKIAEDGQEILGLAGQLLFYRKAAPKRRDGKRETVLHTKRRPRESEVWRRLIAQVGPAPAGQSFVHVCDREADNYEVYAQGLACGASWIIRAAQLHRKVRPVGQAEPDQPRSEAITTIGDLLARQCFAEGYEVAVPATKKTAARTAHVQLRWASFWMPRPDPCSPWAKANAPDFIRMTAVEVYEVQSPCGVKPLRWVLYTRDAVADALGARRIAQDYSRRPTIEDYHKGLKTGCHLQERQYGTAARLERITAVLSVVAVRLLQIRAIARVEPERAAREVVPEEWVNTLYEYTASQSPKYTQRWTPANWTVLEFMRRLAGLGGFLGRKGDGVPGWITLWRGVSKLLLVIEGRRLGHKKCG
jgi:Transposase DNA-binding/Transposase Tn5 dimerisation domain